MVAVTVTAVGHILAGPELSPPMSLILLRSLLVACPTSFATGVKIGLRFVRIHVAILMTIQAFEPVMNRMLYIIPVVGFMRTHIMTIRTCRTIDDFIITLVLGQYHAGALWDFRAPGKRGPQQRRCHRLQRCRGNDHE